MTNLIPIKKRNVFSREEKEQISLVFFESCGIEFFNKTGTQIFELIDGHKNIETISKEMCLKYPNTSKEKIYTEIINFLFTLKNLGIIYMKGELKEMKNGFFVAGEKEYEDIHKFVVKAIKNNEPKEQYINIKEIAFYTTIALRTRSFQLSETFFLEYFDSEIQTIISVSGLDTLTGNVQIQIMMGKNITELFEFTIDYLKLQNINKIKCLCDVDEKTNINFLKQYGFEKEAVLRKELNGNDIYIGAKFI